ALDSRKEYKPKDNAVDVAASMGIELLTEEEYRQLQQLGKFDLKTSSWIKTPAEIRKLGGAVFCDRRYDTVFLYHNGAESYYAARGFRGSLRV
ncbi:MAG TPA: DUF4256 domain-containing protein, partial [Flavobacterium sp.]|uniref:DUF4256 domain-containing protein n=1 Tax=Flavobacterium sp. TaxID=239 RepID=UPI002B580FAE